MDEWISGHGEVSRADLEAAEAWWSSYVEVARESPELGPDEAWLRYQQECLEHISLMNSGVAPPDAIHPTRQEWRSWYEANRKERP